MEETWSAKAWMGALDIWAFSTSLTICARAASEPTLVALIYKVNLTVSKLAAVCAIYVVLQMSSGYCSRGLLGVNR